MGRLQSRFCHMYLHFNYTLHCWHGIQLLDVFVYQKELSQNSHVPNPRNWLFDNMSFTNWNNRTDVGQYRQIWYQVDMHHCHRLALHCMHATDCELPLFSYHTVSETILKVRQTANSEVFLAGFWKNGLIWKTNGVQQMIWSWLIIV